jgi:hypothetical protein
MHQVSKMLFFRETLHVWGIYCAHHQELSPVHVAIGMFHAIQNFILSRNSTCFGHLLCPSSGVISCTRGNWYVSCYPKFYFLTKLYMFRPSSVPIIRSYQLYTWQLVCFMHETYQLPRVQLITPKDGHSRWPKHVEFLDKIKFWILDAFCWLFIRRYEGLTSLNIVLSF